VTHVDDEVLAPLRERFGAPVVLPWEGEISELEWALATHNPTRRHDVTLFILAAAGSVVGKADDTRPEDRGASGPAGARRIALIRKPPFDEGVWRPPGGGILPGEDFVTGAVREALEETGLRVELRRYLVETHAVFHCGARTLPWRTHVFLAETEDTELVPDDPGEIEAARWGTLEELRGPLRERLLATGRAFWRYRVALHDAALEEIEQLGQRRDTRP
jgi:ADP-ribose pyrophosphatase YjhB (NUDIX family)